MNADFTDFFMILYMYIAPGQGQITSDDKISNLYRAFVTSIIFVQFRHDTPTSKGTRGQKSFFVHWRQGQITPMGQILSITGSYYHSEHLL